ncbi:MAG: VWA domain-containing protein [Desulfobulbaceae bacterium]|uniref:VWA domain-containing protein n=1 Tax=Candidatus Desulfobia pelagia TaxID=2841692 RepID=A0A8J6NDJ6_9BACT|nr:VWA domain-containing protein [Candidatus Desulfobia pelagia]
MSDFYFYHIESLLLLWVLPFVVLLFIYDLGKRRKALASFLSPELIPRIPVSSSPTGRIIKMLLFCVAITGIIIGLSRPAWNVKETTISRSGRDVVFILDVSRSMLANDLKPNRLERAKLAIADCISQLQGDRVALVAFAGDAAVKCPLTVDYGFFLQALDATDTTSVSRGGTMLGDAIRTVLNKIFDSQQKQFRDIILITDGEDHESFPLQAAETAGDEGIRLLIVGLGNENEGQRIPVNEHTGQTSFLKYQGEEVWSRLDASTLRQMAKATPGGKYLPVATGSIDLGEVYRDLIATADKKDFETEIIKRHEDKFQIFLALAIILLIVEGLVSERKKWPGNPQKNTERKNVLS